VPAQAVAIQEVPGRAKINLEDAVTKRFDGTVGDGRAVGVRPTPASTTGEPTVLALPEIVDEGTATGKSDGDAGRKNDRRAVETLHGSETVVGAGIGADDGADERPEDAGRFITARSTGAGIGASGVSTSRTGEADNFIGVRKKSTGIGRNSHDPTERPAAF
jgi:hypothetical protein